MSKKQIRISDTGILTTRIHEFVDKQVTLVFDNNTTLFGTLLSVKNNLVSLQNMRLKTITFPTESISELYTDIDG